MGKILRKQKIDKKTVKEISHGLFSALIDLVLYWLVILPIASFGKTRSPQGIYQIFLDAEIIKEQINYHSFRNALRKLKEKGLINSVKDWQNKQIATKEGMKRLKEIFPSYKKERFWDGNLYLVQYDIREEQKWIRDSFRDYFLKKLGAVLIQESSYLVFYNPQELIKQFLKDKPHFNGSIIISKLQKDGFIGESDIKEFIWLKAGLEEVNDQYEDFIKKYKNHKNAREISLPELVKDYLLILQKDPQIPFELLPDRYLGNEAYLLFESLKNTLTKPRPRV